MSTHQSNLLHTNKGSNSTISTYQSQLHRNYKRVDSDVEKLFNQIKKIKYPLLAIQPAEHLENKIALFKNEKLQKQMNLKLIQVKGLNAYRKIRGDGNCFIRALAYSYLSNIQDLSDVNATFFQLNDIDLTICLPESIPKEFKPFYNDKLLKEILLNNWSIDVRYFIHLCKKNNKRILCRMFRKSPYLDFIVILYFRSLCLKGLQKHKEQVKDFMKGTEEDEIRTYGEESEGVILDICSKFMKVGIDVYEVRKQELNHYSYRNEKILKELLNVSLLYYENHYDIIERIEPHLLEEQKNDTKIEEEEYYQKINENMVEGNCIECDKEDYIYEENYLCDHCFQISKSQLLNNARKDKWVRGVCRDCGRSGLKVLEMISLCEACAKRQAEVSEEDIKKSSPTKDSQKCKKCQSELNENQECPKCSTRQVGMCIQCKVKNYIDRQTKLCRQCKDVQLKMYEREQNRQKRMKNQCPKCKQQLDSSYHEYKCLKKPADICHFCNEAKDSQVHEMKCVNKLTAGKIGIARTQKISMKDELRQENESRRCRKCNLLRQNETLVSGWCKRCRDYLDAQERHKNESSYFKSGSIINQSSHKIQEARPNDRGQMCIGCKNKYYVTKLKNGLCSSCQSKYPSRFKF